MMINVLDGRDIRSVSRAELQRISEQLMRITRTLNSEIGMRNEKDEFVFGWREGGQYVTFDTEPQAFEAARKEFGEGGEYKVQKVHL